MGLYRNLIVPVLYIHVHTVITICVNFLIYIFMYIYYLTKCMITYDFTYAWMYKDP